MGRRVSAFGYGTAIGTLGGLIGLDGADFAAGPMGPFGFAAHKAVPLNLLISLITIAASLGFRATVFPTGAIASHLPEIMGLITGGVAAAWFGAGLLHRMSADALERIIALLLLFIAALLLVEAVLPLGVGIALPPAPTLRVGAGVMFGVAIGLVSSLLGVGWRADHPDARRGVRPRHQDGWHGKPADQSAHGSGRRDPPCPPTRLS